LGVPITVRSATSGSDSRLITSHFSLADDTV